MLGLGNNNLPQGHKGDFVNTDDLTLGQIKEIKNFVGNCGAKQTSEHPYTVNDPYLIRTVTHYYTGKLMAVFSQELLLEDAAWVADTGRYHKALETGELAEVEPIKGPVVIGRGAIIDAVKWPNNIPLPRVVK